MAARGDAGRLQRRLNRRTRRLPCRLIRDQTGRAGAELPQIHRARLRQNPDADHTFRD